MKRILSSVFLLFVALIVFVSCTGEESATEPSTEVKDESYRIEKIDGQYYIIFADESAFENPPPNYGDAIVKKMMVEGVYFRSVADMYTSLMEGTLSYSQKFQITRQLSKDDIGYLLPDLDHLLVPVVSEEQFSSQQLYLRGRHYYVEMNVHEPKNLTDMYGFLCYTQEKFEEVYESEYVNALENKFTVIKDRIVSADGRREDIFYDLYFYDLYGGAVHEIRYTVQSGDRTVYARLVMEDNCPGRDRIDVFVKIGECGYYRYTVNVWKGLFSELTEEQLLSFDARFYVPGE